MRFLHSIHLGLAIAPLMLPLTGACIGIDCLVEEVEAMTRNTSAVDPTTDPEWPGVLPAQQSGIGLIINVRYDDYPEETSWVLERWLPNKESDATNSSSIGIATSKVMVQDNSVVLDDGEWVEVLAYDANNVDNSGGVLSSYNQPKMHETVWRFTITDDYDDGICCDYGSGWVTIADSSGVVWSLPGSHFNDFAQVHFWTDAAGKTAVVYPGEAFEVAEVDDSILTNITWLPNYTLATLMGFGEIDTASEQYKALRWVYNHPDYPTMPEWRKQQVFALATFMYAADGERYLRYNESECNWALKSPGSLVASLVERCNEDGELELLKGFPTYEFYGTIPPEIGMLTSLTTIFLSNNYFYSSLPTELFSLPFLGELWVSYNQFGGSIPSEMGLLQSLSSLNLGHNGFTGTIPDEIASLTNLRFVYLNRNPFEGKISTGVCDLELSWIKIDCRRLSCACEECECYP